MKKTAVSVSVSAGKFSFVLVSKVLAKSGIGAPLAFNHAEAKSEGFL